jgi:hypothetical protein
MLIARKMEISDSKCDSSMLEFAAIMAGVQRFTLTLAPALTH